MIEREFEDIKLLWKMFYAGQWFLHARLAAEHLHEQKMENNNPIFYPLMTSVYVMYGKPFKNANIVKKLGDEIIPSDYKNLHKLLLEHRDQVYAHADADAFELPDMGSANQVRALVDSGEIKLFATQFHARFPFLEEVISLCRILEKKTDYHVDKLFKRYLKEIPNNNGEYVLNIYDKSGNVFVKERPILNKRYYKIPSP